MAHAWMIAQANLAHMHATFQQVARALPLSRRDQAGGCGDWTPKQVAAHVAGWDREAARALLALVSGAPEDAVLVGSIALVWNSQLLVALPSVYPAEEGYLHQLSDSGIIIVDLRYLTVSEHGLVKPARRRGFENPSA